MSGQNSINILRNEQLRAVLFQGFVYAATQNWMECYCGKEGDDYARYGASGKCYMQCTGNSSDICGGPWALSVYRTYLGMNFK